MLGAEVKSLLRDNETVSNCCSTMGKGRNHLEAGTQSKKLNFLSISILGIPTTPTSCEVELLTGVGCIFCSRAPKQYMGRHAAS